MKEWVKNEVKTWVEEIEQLSDIACNEPQLAYSAYTIGLSKKWNYLLRTTPGIATELEPIEKAIREKFLPAITGQPFIPDTLRSIMALPTRMGGLGVENPCHMADLEYQNSLKATEELQKAIQKQDVEYIPNPEIEKALALGIKTGKANYHKECREKIIQLIKPREARNLDLLSEKGASTWLTCLPLQSLKLTLNRQEFFDSISARYNHPLVGQPRATQCVCGEENTIDHSMSCKRGGFVAVRHDCVRDFLTAELDKVCYDTKAEPHLLEVRGAKLPPGTTTEDGARLDIRTRGFWGPMDCTYFDVRVFNPRAQSNGTQDIPRTYIKHEEEKKKNYLHRIIEVEKASFTPLVMSTTGGLGQEFSKTLKQLATKKSRKTGYTYQECIRYLRVRLSFSMVRSITCSIRGYRGRNKNDGSSSDLYHTY